MTGAMTGTMTGSAGLVRVSVVAGERRADLALPGALPVAELLPELARAVGVLDAQTVLVGMQPAVAITLVELGMSLPGVRTALNVDKGLALLQSAIEEGDHGAGDGY